MIEGARQVAAALNAVAVPGDARELSRFFKTGKGEYGAGDKFIGVRVPAIRAIAKQFVELSPADLNDLLDSEFHEHRFAALAILVLQYTKAQPAEQEWFYDFYLAAMRRGRVNNWDLVDSSAEYIVGAYLVDKPRELLVRLSRSGIVWERRIAVLSTFAFIKKGDASTTLELAATLLEDRHDLIQKAVGWMLREVGKRVDRDLLVGFLREHAPRMPRVMLAYATEHLSPAERVYFRSR
ncbi:MAG: DNA alkylation repair protein [Salinibacterium sp.]|nr:DNA alkylation repair protein [Salinibacterium sp.]